MLLSFAIDPSTGQRYGRLLGGRVESGELAEDAVRREMQEELGADVTVLRRLGVVENLFRHDGRAFHEVIFVFECAFADRSLYGRETFAVAEAVCDGPACWVPLHRLLAGDPAIYPDDLLALLR